ncbi:MAG: hypothetical protein JXR96_12875 [Deltaproteobacteria bacterium]|nr:hypothetical protein [Deltaproteobacteria bacterium]
MSLCVEAPVPEQPGEHPDAIVLRGRHADGYVDSLALALHAARLNAFFPPVPPLLAHLSFLGPRGSRGLRRSLRLAPHNGLPSAAEVLRVLIDREAARHSRPDQAVPRGASRLARRLRYYRALDGAELMPFQRTRVDLRQQLLEEKQARFRVVMDHYDPVGVQFVRYTILLGQEDGAFGERLIELDRDLAEPTRIFRRKLSQLGSQAAERVFAELDAHPALEVEDVRRCRVGPMLLPGMPPRAAPLAPLLDPASSPCPASQTPWVLAFPEERAALDMLRSADADPLALLLGQPAAALESPEGSCLARSCKLVCPQPLCAPLAELCRELGRPCIVRPIAGASHG